MVLLIDRVYDQHFRIYYFEAENKLGKVIHEVELLMGTFSIALAIGNHIYYVGTVNGPTSITRLGVLKM